VGATTEEEDIAGVSDDYNDNDDNDNNDDAAITSDGKDDDPHCHQSI
jgi:hypothetical protein